MTVLFNQQQIEKRIEEIATQIFNRHKSEKKPIILICVLNGGFMFYSELVKLNEATELEDAFEVDFYPHVILSHKGKTKAYQGLIPIKELYDSII